MFLYITYNIYNPKTIYNFKNKKGVFKCSKLQFSKFRKHVFVISSSDQGLRCSLSNKADEEANEVSMCPFKEVDFWLVYVLGA